MKLKMPSYCEDFSCLAGACRDSCCIGWEIDIDEKTAAFYDSVEGDLGKRLRENITDGEIRSIRLCGERCPFLNEKGLCDIILQLGEAHISEICTEHPRYYAWFEGCKEGGIGLSCEEAARLILTSEAPISFVEKAIPEEEAELYDRELFNLLYDVRERIFAILTDGTRSFSARMCAVLDLAKDCQTHLGSEDEQDDEAPFSAILAAFSHLEVMDAAWLPKLASIAVEDGICREDGMEKYLENLAIYFIYRHFLLSVFDGEVLVRVKLCAVSVLIIAALWRKTRDEKGSLSESDAAWMAKCYSKEIEYNEDNEDALFFAFYDDPAFGTENLKRFFR